MDRLRALGFFVLFSHFVLVFSDADLDIKSLLEFKKSIMVNNRPVLANWNEGNAANNACNWTGIVCSRKHRGQVTGIHLSGRGLHGHISSHLSNLSFLQVLDLSNNSFIGEMPASFGRLSRLRELNLGSNNLTGIIPHEIGNLSSLENLLLYQNSLVGSIPASLGKLKLLNILLLFQNKLTGNIPSKLFNSTSLTDLELSANSLGGTIPLSIGKLHKLQWLSLSANFFKGTIPQALANATSLVNVDFTLNQLHGTLPAWFGSLKRLNTVTIGGNLLSGNVPDSWQNASDLTAVDISQNSLNGMLPSWWAKLNKLTKLKLGYNSLMSGVMGFSQPVPVLQALSNYSKLQLLGLDSNLLHGTLPWKLGYFWPDLLELNLYSNFITGVIPKSIANLSNAYLIDLGRNLVSGSMPSELGRMKDIQVIALDDNKLQGRIPKEWTLLNQSLSYLFLQGNSFSGPIPSSLGELTNLRKLHLNNNKLSGQIPWELGNCADLEVLDLSTNNLSGTIPATIAGLRHIQYYDLSQNLLSGEVPPSIGGLVMAEHINLSCNLLSGNIAIHIVEWLNAVNVNLSFNNFDGNLSKSLGNKLTQLESMDLSHNEITGPIPESLSNLTFLRVLNLSFNNFEGSVNCSEGSLRRLKNQSFMHNPGLCGNCYGLRPCNVPKHHLHIHRSRKRKFKIVAASIASLLAVLLLGLGIFLLSKRSKKPAARSQYRRIAPEELQNATDNFSEGNLIGTGNYGKVFQGTLNDGERVAIKVLWSWSCDENKMRSDRVFLRECRILGKVRHRNIVKIISVVCSDDIKALVMPLMSNGSLYTLLHQHARTETSLNLQVRLSILKELSSGLSYLHHDCNPPIIHCDIKPENVLLDGDMTVQIADFGIASMMGYFNEATTSSSLAVKGTVGYVAPEYGLGATASTKGDVFSFGMLILEVITGIKPTDAMFEGHMTLRKWVSLAFEGETEEDKRNRIKEMVKTEHDEKAGIDIDNQQELEAVVSVLTLGLRCTWENAEMRPSMREVESILSLISSSLTENNSENVMRLNCNDLETVLKIVEAQPPIDPYGKAKSIHSSSSTL